MGRTRCVAWIVFMWISTSIFFTVHCLPVETLHDTAALDPDIYRNVVSQFLMHVCFYNANISNLF